MRPNTTSKLVLIYIWITVPKRHLKNQERSSCLLYHPSICSNSHQKWTKFSALVDWDKRRKIQRELKSSSGRNAMIAFGWSGTSRIPTSVYDSASHNDDKTYSPTGKWPLIPPLPESCSQSHSTTRSSETWPHSKCSTLCTTVQATKNWRQRLGLIVATITTTAAHFTAISESETTWYVHD